MMSNFINDEHFKNIRDKCTEMIEAFEEPITADEAILIADVNKLINCISQERFYLFCSVDVPTLYIIQYKYN